MNTQASRFVGSIPQQYDHYLGPLIFQGFADDIATRVARLQPTAVLELAAGTGIVTRQLRSRLPADCVLTATDLNPPMLEMAKSKFEPGEAIQFESADANALPFDESTFDALVCQFGVMFFPDKLHSYREALRVLKPGGQYIFNVWGSWAENPFAQVAHNTVAEFFPDDPPGFYKVPFGYNDAADIQKLLLQAGFSDVAITPLQIRSDIPSARQFAKGLIFGNPLLEEVNNRGGDPEQICAAVAAAVERELGDSMQLEAMIIEAQA